MICRSGPETPTTKYYFSSRTARTNDFIGCACGCVATSAGGNSQHNLIERITASDLGSGGVVLTGGDRITLESGNTQGRLPDTVTLWRDTHLNRKTHTKLQLGIGSRM